MKEILQMLKPTPLAFMVLVVLGLGTFLFLGSSQTTTSLGAAGSTQTTYSIGPGSLVKIITEPHGRRTYDIRWVLLALNLAVSYAAAVIAKGMILATGLRRPATAYGTIALITLGITFVIAIFLSKNVWGYYLARPGLIPEMEKISKVTAVAAIKTETNAAGKRVFVINPQSTIAASIESGKSDSYYCLKERILIDLGQRKLLPAALASSMPDLPELYQEIQGSGALVASDPGYASDDRLHGIVVDATDDRGRRLRLVGVEGGEISNDHYPYYELLFQGPPQSGQLTFVRGQHFYYDVAGMEGFEWYGAWVIFAIPGIILGSFALTIYRIIGESIRRKRALSPEASAC